MPEGPEIRREADEIEEAVGGEETTHVEFGLEELAEYGDELTGRRVEKVTSWGKAILTHFEGDRVIYSHNQLYGKWYVQEAGNRPETDRQLRLTIETEKMAALLYSASEIDVLDAGELDDHPFLSKLGPDALDEDLDAETVAERLQTDAFRRRQLATVLLDQGFVAGLGNYLRAEILHVAGIHPKKKADDLHEDDIAALSEAILHIPRRSYETGGVTLDQERYEELRAEGESSSQARFMVYEREGEACYGCGEEIERIQAGGRKIFFCPACQPAE